MLTGKQSSALKALAHNITPVTSVGKAGVTDSVLDSIDSYLAVHELMKVSVQEGAMLETKEVANEVADRLGAEFVQAIGRRFVIYRPATDEKNRKIVI